MAMSHDPVFAQTPKTFAVPFSSAVTATDGTGVTSLFTAGADGALITSLRAVARATASASAIRLYWSFDNGTTWLMIDEKLMAAWTVSTTTAQPGLTLVDKSNPDAAMRIGGNVRIGATQAVANNIVISGEYLDF